ncbi:RNA polymerase factor sigma-54 [candidate division GN15 bacterium]|nr:RNA polymerase factor sigma-54 [candidate division GN15 bacterium]
MKLGLNQGLKISQQLKLAPQLIQSLNLLQMPALKLEQKIREELTMNPMLEEVDGAEQDQNEEQELDLVKEESKEKEEVDWDEYLYDDDEGYKVREPRESNEDRLEGTATRAETLYDHLHEQLMLLKLSEEETMIGQYIIGNVSPDGYLSISVPEMADELEIDPSQIEAVLKKIQRFDPVGVASRDLRESLLIQLEEKGLKGSLAWRIVDEHLFDLDRKSVQQVAKLMGVPAERAQDAMETIKSLSPSPAQGRFDPGAMPVVPDLIVERFGDQIVVAHNDSYLPRLRISPHYRDLAKRGSNSSKDAKEYIHQKLEHARWLLNAINQRRNTMIRVMEAIVDAQREFFEKGTEYLKPLIMEDIAQVVEMNVATISRVSKEKYVQTPFGVYEIKHFFNSGISREDGEDLSKHRVKQRIEEIIANEPPEKPHSDQEIHKRLKAEGIQLARRTVTKYREELRIQPARLRKRVS